jgi:protein-S-isoprenylcysteine O-methyltransferase Ste14
MISQEHSEHQHPIENPWWVIREEDWAPTKMLLLILGIEIPLIGGFWVWNNDPWYYGLFLTVLLGALLLRSWWALLIVPVVLAIGIALGILLPPLLQGGQSALQERLESGLEGVDILLVLGTPAVLVLAAFGTVFGVFLGKGMARLREEQVDKF